MRFCFACAFVRMQSNARMLQPLRSGVIHAYVKERAREEMGTAVPARARLHPRNARTGTHGTGCACRCFLAGRTSTLCSVDASGARELDGGISKAPVSIDTLYCRESCRRFPDG